MHRFLTSLLIAVLSSMLMCLPANAVNPDEILKDPILEERARELSKEIRCMVCQNQSIDDSDATVAKDLRVLIRERLSAGDSNEQVITFLVSRFGEFVLLRPRLSLSNAILWIAPVLFLALGVLFGIILMRRNTKAKTLAVPNSLSDEEKKALTKILGDQK